MTKKPLALATALIAGTLALPTVAQQQNTQQPQGQQQGMQTQQQGMQSGARQQGQQSIRVGHNVVDAVDDVRESTADLVSALRRSGEGMGMSNWQQSHGQLEKMEQQLDQMEQTLDKKADQADEGWLAWLSDDDYKVTVTEQVNTLARNLDEISKMLGGAKGQNMQQVRSANVMAQVDDLQETVEDLVQALEDADNLQIDKQRLQQAQQRLDRIEQELDRQGDMADDEWGRYATGQEFTPGVQKTVAELAEIMRSLFQQGG